jgi:hypothetical protein
MKVRATGEQKGCIGSGVPMCNRMDMARVTNCKRRNHCSQDRVLVCRIVRSYIPRHLNRASTLLRFVFALFSSVCSVFLLFSLFFVCFLCFSSTFTVILLGSSIFLYFFSQLYQQPTDPTYESCYDPRFYDLSPAYRSYLKT